MPNHSERPHLMEQRWLNLLFAHWPVDPAVIRPLIPAGLELDLWEGKAWIGVVPFEMRGIAHRSGLPILGASAFPELNVRTYVVRDGVKGVWFFSLDAGSRLAVWGARRFFHLPYFKARFAVKTERDGLAYRMERGEKARFSGKYRPQGPSFKARPGTLAQFLTERYCLYAADKAGGLYRGEIAHEPWTLQAASLDLQVNTVAAAAGIELPATAPHLLFAKELKVQVWGLDRL
ncbi:MAG TPA: DUF2071 domain-containing protein [Symbiobacteriaceae bacterium]|nr:DUF2071 domain-containing protein [Symbiobacteriaceae bacterium]